MWGSGWGENLARSREETKPLAQAYKAPASKVPLETDSDLRKRLFYIAGGSREPHNQQRISAANTDELNRMAEEWGIKRRGDA